MVAVGLRVVVLLVLLFLLSLLLRVAGCSVAEEGPLASLPEGTLEGKSAVSGTLSTEQPLLLLLVLRCCLLLSMMKATTHEAVHMHTYVHLK